jgi:hypothetical protein
MSEQVIETSEPIVESNESSEVNESVEENLNEEMNQNESSEELSVEESAEIEEEIQDEIDNAETAEERADAIQKMINFKSNGKDYTFDLSNEEQMQQLIKMAQLGDGAQAKMQQATETEKAWKKYQEDLRSNPWKILQEEGFDPDELAEARIQQIIDEAQKSPEQKAQEKMEAELEALRKQIKEKEESEKRSEMERLQYEAEIELDQQITEALNSTTELPKSPYVVKKIADAMLFAMNNGFEDITPSQVIPIVSKDINKELQQMFDVMPEAVMEKYIGQKNMERLRKNRLKKMRQTKNINNVKQTGKIEEKKKSESDKKLAREFFSNL